MTDEKSSLDRIYELMSDEETRKAMLGMLVGEELKEFLKDIDNKQVKQSDTLAKHEEILGRHEYKLSDLESAFDKFQSTASTGTRAPATSTAAKTDAAVQALADVNRVTNSSRPDGKKDPVLRNVSDYRKNERPDPLKLKK